MKNIRLWTIFGARVFQAKKTTSSTLSNTYTQGRGIKEFKIFVFFSPPPPASHRVAK